MNTKILEQLEFDKVKILFAKYLQTEQANQELQDLRPLSDADKLDHYFLEIEDMGAIFQEHPYFEVGGEY